MTEAVIRFLRVLRPDEGDWRDRAVCAQTDPEAFFPPKGGSARPAKAVCRVCPVRRTCLEYALENGIEHGIWGGLSVPQRQRIRRGEQQLEGRAA